MTIHESKYWERDLVICNEDNEMNNEKLHSDTSKIQCSASIDATEQLTKVWNNFCEKLDNDRFFLDKSDNFLEIFIARVKECVVSKSEVHYRARENKDDKKIFSETDLMAPKAEICNAGRLNPKGVSYMYIADTPITAISEIRTWIGARVQVAKCTSQKELVLKDFTYDNSEKDSMVLKYNKILSEIFSKPISIYDKDKEYLITQCIAEYIKNYAKRKDGLFGYDGIKYTSSAHVGGYNIVVFNAKQIKIGEVSNIMTIGNIIVECSEAEQFMGEI